MFLEEQWDIKSMTLPELEAEFRSLGQPAFRAKQVFGWLHRGVRSFDEMTNLSKDFRQQCKERYQIYTAQIERKLISALDGTVKYLFRLHDGEYVESVLMQYHHGYSICISTQVGCRMGCAFCATGLGGFFRNLAPSEMLAQIQAAQQDRQIRISNVVLMGMGEPLDNFDCVVRFLELVTAEDGMNIGMRHISLSTCGLVDRIYQLMEKNFQLTLSVSLHAPNDALRSQTMPVNRKWPVESLLKACRDYADHTGRRISFEYAMIDGLNDSDECARELAQRLRGILCHVNLIPVNQVTENGYRRSGRDRLKRFSGILTQHHINVTVRRTLGADIDASCGQLRRKITQGEAASVETLHED